MSTLKPLTWFDWAESFVGRRKAALSQKWEGYSAASVVVLTESEDAARSLDCNAIGVEHLLAGFLKCEGNRVFQVVRSLDISLETLRSEIERQWGPHRVIEHEWRLPFTPRCKSVFDRACERARLDSARLVEPDDLFIELVDEKGGLVAELFRRRGINVALIREALES